MVISGIAMAAGVAAIVSVTETDMQPPAIRGNIATAASIIFMASLPWFRDSARIMRWLNLYPHRAAGIAAAETSC